MTAASHELVPSEGASDLPQPEGADGSHEISTEQGALPEVTGQEGGPAGPLGFLGDVPMQLEIRLGGAELAIEELLKLATGDVVALERRADDPVEIVAGGRVIARGEMVVVDGGLGVRITELCGGGGGASD